MTAAIAARRRPATRRPPWRGCAPSTTAASWSSAAPLPPSRATAGAQEGEYNLIELPERINRRPLPEVTIADMRREGAPRQRQPLFGGAARRAGGTASRAAIRRSCSSTAAATRRASSAANAVTSPSASNATSPSPITARKTVSNAITAARRIKCSPPAPECGGTRLSYAGSGTQKVAGALQKLYPQAAHPAHGRGHHGGQGGASAHPPPLRRARGGHSSSARRWSPRGTTSPRSPSWASSTRT